MRILVDRFIYQGLRYAPSRHAALISLYAGPLQDQDEKGSLCACEMARIRAGPGGFHVGMASDLVELGAPGVVAFSMPLPESRAYDAVVAFYRETHQHNIGRATLLSYRKISATAPSYVWLSLTCYGDARLQLPSLAAGGEPVSSVTDSTSWITVLRYHAVARTDVSLAKALAAAHEAPERLRDGLEELASAFRSGFESKLAARMSVLEERLLLEDELSDAERLSIRLLVGLGRAHSVGIDAQPVRWPTSDSEATVLHDELELVSEGAAAIYDWGMCGLGQLLAGRLLVFEGWRDSKMDRDPEEAIDLLSEGAQMLSAYATTSDFCRRLTAETRATLADVGRAERGR